MWPIMVTHTQNFAPHLTHPSAHTPGAVGSLLCCSTQGSVGGSGFFTQGTHLSLGIKGGENARSLLPPPKIPAGPEIWTHNLRLQVRRSIH